VSTHLSLLKIRRESIYRMSVVRGSLAVPVSSRARTAPSRMNAMPMWVPGRRRRRTQQGRREADSDSPSPFRSGLTNWRKLRDYDIAAYSPNEKLQYQMLQRHEDIGLQIADVTEVVQELQAGSRSHRVRD
jgi:hypothetical protein